MDKLKLFWKVQPEPIGRYRSFGRRGWPIATFSNGDMAAYIRCSDEYIPRNVKYGNHDELIVWIADHSTRELDPDAAAFEWRRLKKTAPTLKAAKELALEFYSSPKNEKFLPKEYRVEV